MTKPSTRNRTSIAVLSTIALLSAAFAGCSGASSEEPLSFSVSHRESSEKSRATIEDAPNRDLDYDSLRIMVDGKAYQFGEFASWEDRRYQVDGKRDASEAVEAGDVITIPAVGRVTVAFWVGDEMVTSFEANIPDNLAPAAPSLLEPSNHAQGVSKAPTFRWQSASDVSGIRYHVAYSLDPTLSSGTLGVVVTDLTTTLYQVPAGKELNSGLTYYWHVQAEDGAGNMSPWSQTYAFTVG